MMCIARIFLSTVRLLEAPTSNPDSGLEVSEEIALCWSTLRTSNPLAIRLTAPKSLDTRLYRQDEPFGFQKAARVLILPTVIYMIVITGPAENSSIHHF